LRENHLQKSKNFSTSIKKREILLVWIWPENFSKCDIPEAVDMQIIRVEKSIVMKISKSQKRCEKFLNIEVKEINSTIEIQKLKKFSLKKQTL